MLSQLSITTLLIIIIAGISWWAFEKMDIRQKLIMHPYTVLRHKQYYRLLSSGFIHGDFMHLAFNCYALYLFGAEHTNSLGEKSGVEFHFINIFGNTKGIIYYILLFLLGIIFSDIPTLFKHKNNSGYFSLGASGGVSSVMFACIMFNPLMGLHFFFIPIEIPAFILGIGYLIYSHYGDKQQQDNIGHSAHLYGALFGIVFTVVMYPPVIINFYTQIIERYF